MDGSGDLPSILYASELTRDRTAPVRGVSPIAKRDDDYFRNKIAECDSPKPKIQFFNPDRKKLGLSSPIKPFKADESQDYLKEKDEEQKPQSKARSEFSVVTKRPMDHKAVRYRYLCKLTYKGVW